MKLYSTLKINLFSSSEKKVFICVDNTQLIFLDEGEGSFIDENVLIF